MKTLAVMSRKGGAGKTTVAVNLTLAARAMGIRAVLADADPMRSAHEVLKGREEAPSLLFETSASKLFTLTEAAAPGPNFSSSTPPPPRRPTWPRR